MRINYKKDSLGRPDFGYEIYDETRLIAFGTFKEEELEDMINHWMGTFPGCTIRRFYSTEEVDEMVMKGSMGELPE